MRLHHAVSFPMIVHGAVVELLKRKGNQDRPSSGAMISIAKEIGPTEW
jgi:hypothetical protein